MTMRPLLALAAGLLVLRLYAAFWTQAACTWDDHMYRQTGERALPVASVLRHLIFPTTLNMTPDRTMGYPLWLWLGTNIVTPIFGPSGKCANTRHEWTWQVVNCILLMIQIAALFGVARWATGETWSAMAVLLLYVMSPLVFGLNRWAMSENLVMTALLVTIAVGVLVVHDGRWWIQIAAGILCGIFSNAREYAYPILVTLALGASCASYVQRGWRALWFPLILFPYLIAAGVANFPAFQLRWPLVGATTPGPGIPEGAYPVLPWLLKLFRDGWGPSVTIVVVLGSAVLARSVWHNRGQWRWDGASVYWMSLAGAFVLWWCLDLSQPMRQVRAGIGPEVLGLGIVLVGWHHQRLHLLPAGRMLLALFLTASLAFLVDDLFIRFDGGRTWRHEAGPRLETYNHPLGLRAMTDDNDRHSNCRVSEYTCE